MQCPFDKDLLRKFLMQKTPVVFDGIVLFDSFEKVYDNAQWSLTYYHQDEDWPDPLTEQFTKVHILLQDINRKMSANLLFVHYDNDAMYIAESSDVYDFSNNFPMNSKFFMFWLYGNDSGKEKFQIMSRL